MKKLIITILIIATTLNITACGNSENAQYTSEEYLPESDDQPNIIYGRNFIEGNSGYYFYDPMDNIQFYDFNLKKTHILCNKPECTHEDEECSSYTGGVTLRYAEGNLYYVAEEGTTGDVYFWRKSGDGSKTEKLFLLYHFDEPQVEIASTLFCIHRDYVYYFLQGMEEGYSSVLYRRKLEKNAKIEVLEALESEAQDYDEVYGCGNKIYYVLDSYEKDNRYMELRSYDIISGEKKTELKRMGLGESYYIYNNKMFYTSEQNICELDLKNGEDKVIMSGEFSESVFVHADDKYLYFDNSCDIEKRLDQLEHIEEKMKEWYQDRKVYVYDKETLQQVNVLSIPTETFADFNVTSNYLTLRILGDEFRILDKNSLTNENPEWVKIYSSLD
ncbi:MAG: hypothetical protein IJF03_01055 [Lachnospiraceae bacterium]|nr:hypothetical protein [Lachnospiraceae bacterium]